jgi:hypothetical protein
MNVYCGSKAVTERREVTARGYRRFRCRNCGRQFNERSNGVLNRTCLPSDIIAFVVFCRLRYRLTLRDLSEIIALRGIEVSHEAIRDWKAMLLPVMGGRAAQTASRNPAPLPGDRPGRKPDRRDAGRASRYVRPKPSSARPGRPWAFDRGRGSGAVTHTTAGGHVILAFRPGE